MSGRRTIVITTASARHTSQSANTRICRPVSPGRSRSEWTVTSSGTPQVAAVDQRQEALGRLEIDLLRLIEDRVDGPDVVRELQHLEIALVEARQRRQERPRHDELLALLRQALADHRQLVELEE